MDRLRSRECPLPKRRLPDTMPHTYRAENLVAEPQVVAIDPIRLDLRRLA